MNETSKRLINERIRLVQIRQGLTAALAINDDSAALTPFYQAASNYLQYAMHRLHQQDIKMLATIKTKTDRENIDTGTALSEAHGRVKTSQTLLNEFSEKSADLNEQSLVVFENICQRYCQYIVNSMGHHAPSANLAQTLFSEKDWLNMANFSDETTALEQQLFDKATELAPDTIQLIIETKPVRKRPAE
jgi:hypothetical protein